MPSSTYCTTTTADLTGHSMLLQDALFPLLFGHKCIDHHTEHRGTGCFRLRVLRLLLQGNIAKYLYGRCIAKTVSDYDKYHYTWRCNEYPYERPEHL